MPKLTILNHWRNPVEIVILNVVTVTLPPGEKLERELNGPVRLRARATGNDRNFIRDGDSADGLVQNRVFVVEVPDPNAAQFEFRVS
jgi:hypothetical protein